MKYKIFCGFAVLVFAVAMTPAQTKLSSSGKCGKPAEQHEMAAGDQIGHVFTLASGKCVTKGEVAGGKRTNWLQDSSGPNSLCSGHEGRKARRKRQGGRMRKAYLLVAAMLLAGIPASAKEPQAGTIVSESSVACGSQVTKNKKGTMEVLCQEYVVRTETTEYHVRQEKAAKQEMIPVNTSIEFTLDKDKMKFKANGKKYEYIVVSESAVTAAKP
jgi:hypothetical protein